jgi:NADPH:quinone reductase-like Zn-dependent oxidoreductase
MLAAVFTQYGGPENLVLKEVPRPVPKDDEVLVRVRAVSINEWDFGALQGKPFVNRMIFGLRKPTLQILGSDVAGTVEAVGRNVRNLAPGDDVFGDLNGSWGGFADYVCAKETAWARKPAGMTFEQAAAIPQAGLLALQGLRKGGIRDGQTILINGAGGGVGIFSLQLARMHGARITAVDRPEKETLVRSLGAGDFIDYSKEDFTRTGRRYDLILDVMTDRPMSAYARALTPGGTYVTVGGRHARLLQTFLLGRLVACRQRKKLHVLALRTNEGLSEMTALFEAGTVRPVIDGDYSARQTIDAFRHYSTGLHQGKIVITWA